MVIDFNNLNWFKQWIDDYVDHKFLVDIEDPLLINFLNVFEGFNFKQPKDIFTLDNLNLLEIKKAFARFNKEELQKKIENPPLREFYESLVIVSFLPTAENISKWVYDVVDEFLKEQGFSQNILYKVEFFETPKSAARFQKDF
jgi:6-pyruvoyltetrahydropterin/6-carboxytetrahydropterin synthase